jgi:hypothetical protein
LSRRDCLAAFRSENAGEDDVEMDVKEPDESAVVKEKPELELDERELEREWAETVDGGENGLPGVKDWVRIGVIRVGALTWSAIIAKSWSSSSGSFSRSCCASVLGCNLPRAAGVCRRADDRLHFSSATGAEGVSSAQTVISELSPLQRTETRPGSTKRSNSRPPSREIQSNHCTPAARQAE